LYLIVIVNWLHLPTLIKGFDYDDDVDNNQSMSNSRIY